MDEIVRQLIEFVQSIDPVTRTIAAGIAVLLETSVLIGLIVPGDTVVLAASIGITSPAQAAAMIVAVVVGALIGESIGFFLGRWIGPRLRVSWVGRRIGEKNWQRAERYFARRGGAAIFLSRFLPVLHSLVPLTVGMSGYPYRRFLAWTAPACLIWAGAYVGITSFAAGSFEQLKNEVRYAGYLFVGLIVLLLLLLLLGKKLLHRWESRHMHDDTPAEESTPAKDSAPMKD